MCFILNVVQSALRRDTIAWNDKKSGAEKVFVALAQIEHVYNDTQTQTFTHTESSSVSPFLKMLRKYAKRQFAAEHNFGSWAESFLFTSSLFSLSSSLELDGLALESTSYPNRAWYIIKCVYIWSRCICHIHANLKLASFSALSCTMAHATHTGKVRSLYIWLSFYRIHHTGRPHNKTDTRWQINEKFALKLHTVFNLYGIRASYLYYILVSCTQDVTRRNVYGVHGSSSNRSHKCKIQRRKI